MKKIKLLIVLTAIAAALIGCSKKVLRHPPLLQWETMTVDAGEHTIGNISTYPFDEAIIVWRATDFEHDPILIGNGKITTGIYGSVSIESPKVLVSLERNNTPNPVRLEVRLYRKGHQLSLFTIKQNGKIE